MATKRNKPSRSYPLQDAFFHLIDQQDAWRILGVSKQTVANRRVQARLGIYPRESGMRAWLDHAGWRCAAVERWRPTKPLPPKRPYTSRPPRKRVPAKPLIKRGSSGRPKAKVGKRKR